jgi:glycosyltransferase involved in cell wall biosynthesis
VPLIVDCHNIEHILLERFMTHERNPLRKAYAWVEARKLRRCEQETCARASLVMVCSQEDRSMLRELVATVPVTVSPNVIDLDRYSTTTETLKNGAAVLFTAGMDWYPNRDAVEYFVFSVLPILRNRMPNVKFIVAGRSPSDKFRRRFAGISGVEFTGFVPDMRDVIAQATVCVAPLRIGSGTRLKILEAAAMGKAIVSTTVGSEGLEFVPREEIIIADEPQTFAQAVAAVLNNGPLRKRLGEAARRRVERDYSFPVLCSAMRQGLAELSTD